MAKESKNVRLSAMLKSLLGKNLNVNQFTPEELSNLCEGSHCMTNGEALATKIMQVAVQGREWAVQLVLERTEGRSVTATKEDGTDKTIEEKLDHVTTQHLNELARRLGAKPGFPEQPAPVPEQQADAPARDVPTGPSSRLLHLSKNRSRDSKDV